LTKNRQGSDLVQGLSGYARGRRLIARQTIL
jgi:hypothetical protein